MHSIDRHIDPDRDAPPGRASELQVPSSFQPRVGRSLMGALEVLDGSPAEGTDERHHASLSRFIRPASPPSSPPSTLTLRQSAAEFGALEHHSHPHPNPAFAMSWSRGWCGAMDTADPLGLWSRTQRFAVSGRLTPQRMYGASEDHRLWRSITRCKHPLNSSPTDCPLYVMVERQVHSHGHCDPDGSMVSDLSGSQCPVGSPARKVGQS